MHIPTPIAWTGDRAVRILDQTALPGAERWLELRTVEAVAEAIRALRVRGAPLIGIAGAMGATLALRDANGGREAALAALDAACRTLAATRPTAVNLAWALARVRRAAAAAGDADEVHEAAVREAAGILDEERERCLAIGRAGSALVADGAMVGTICNAGALATGGIGTALAPVYVAHAQGRRVRVLVPETRPLLQGSRLTAWELARAGVPCTVMVDGAMAARLRAGDVTVIIVGADRIAANGDFANKVGTYALALAAREHRVPFYVAAPRSTFDPATPSGHEIPIEERAAAEVRPGDAPAEVGVWNPAFDVTPAALVAGYITDAGVLHASELGALASVTTPER